MELDHSTIVYVLSVGGWVSLSAAALLFLYYRHRPQDWEKEEEASKVWDQKVDPWVLQRELMKASGQRMPTSPHLTNDSTLYLALILEEVAELMKAHAEALSAGWRADRRERDEPMSPERRMLLWVLNDYQQIESHSKLIRGGVAKVGPFNLKMTDREHIRPIFDGTIDLQVVNSGYALASGLPVEAGYLEVQASNLSKRNDAGVIAKDPSGKWIKDPNNYEPPDLDAVLAAYEVDNDQSRA